MKKHQSHKKRWIAFLLVVAMVLSITRPEMMKYIFAAEAGSEVVSEDGITNGEENAEPGTEADSEAEPVEEDTSEPPKGIEQGKESEEADTTKVEDSDASMQQAEAMELTAHSDSSGCTVTLQAPAGSLS